jgi:hypothetical protein
MLRVSQFHLRLALASTASICTKQPSAQRIFSAFVFIYANKYCLALNAIQQKPCKGFAFARNFNAISRRVCATVL